MTKRKNYNKELITSFDWELQEEMDWLKRRLGFLRQVKTTIIGKRLTPETLEDIVFKYADVADPANMVGMYIDLYGTEQLEDPFYSIITTDENNNERQYA